MHAHFFTLAVNAISSSAMFATGSGLIFLGAIARWRYSIVLIRAEENAKDGLLSEDQARRRIAVARFAGPTLVLLGMSAFALVLWM